MTASQAETDMRQSVTQNCCHVGTICHTMDLPDYWHTEACYYIQYNVYAAAHRQPKQYHNVQNRLDGREKVFFAWPVKQHLRCARGLNCSKLKLKILVDFLTSHIALYRDLTVMKIHINPQCPACPGREINFI